MPRESYDLIIEGGHAVLEEGVLRADIGVDKGRIKAAGDLGAAAARERFDASGLHILAGVIDGHVHLREPGATHAEDMASGTKSAVLGGVTSVFDMPNTSPATTDAAAFHDKLARAQGRAWCDYGFFIGATPANASELAALETLSGCAGVKLFMASSTGALLVAEDEEIARVLHSGNRRVAVHAEDESRITARRHLCVEEKGCAAAHPRWRDVLSAVNATRRLLRLSAATRRRVHILHLSTAEEVAEIAKARALGVEVTAEATPHHLTLAAPDCYERLGNLAVVNPPLREARHRNALWRAVADGVIDVTGSDHAPHLLSEKKRPWPQCPSGVPGTQTLLPLMLNACACGQLTLERVAQLTSASPARIHGVADKGRLAVGLDADMVLVDLKKRRVIEERFMATACGWTPYAGMTIQGWPVATILRGQIIMRDGEILSAPQGRPVRFAHEDSSSP